MDLIVLVLMLDKICVEQAILIGIDIMEQLDQEFDEMTPPDMKEGDLSALSVISSRGRHISDVKYHDKYCVRCASIRISGPNSFRCESND